MSFSKPLDTIKKYRMIEKNDRIVAGVSGGADSVCLLFFLLSIKDVFSLELYVAHVNHTLRGASSDRDETFVRDLAGRLGIDFFKKNADVTSLAAQNGQTIEECGRVVRYAFFDEVAFKTGANKIATAHNLCDNAETVLMNLIRGTGLAGLSGIPPVRGNIIRPLIETDRQEIEQYLKSQNISFTEDETNKENDYHRNRIRNELIPLLCESYNSAVIENLARLSQISRGVLEYAQTQIEKDIPVKTDDYGVFVPIPELLHLNDATLGLVIKNMVKILAGDAQNIASVHIENAISIIRRCETGKYAVLPGGIKAEVSYDTFYITFDKTTHHFCYRLELENTLILPETGHVVTSSVLAGDYRPQPDELVFDYDRLLGKALFIRTRKDGDRFVPSGMTGSKKVKDYFIDCKIPKFLRDSMLIFTADEEIIAVGNRTAAGYAPDSSAKRSIVIKIQK